MVDKKEFIEQLAQKTGMSIREARAALNACLDLIILVNSRHEEVNLSGFGTFEVAPNGRASKPTKDEVERQRKRFRPIFLPELSFVESLS